LPDIVVQGAAQTASDLTRISQELPERARVGVRLGAEYFRSRMMAEMLSGQRLKVRSDRLRGGWGIADLSTGTHVAVVVGTRVPYAAVHEYGFSGAVVVQEHARQLPTARAQKERQRVARLGPKGQERAAREAEARRAARDARKARVPRRVSLARYGPVVGDRDRARASGYAIVRSHSRNMNLPARWYVRDSLHQFADGIVATVRKYVFGGAS